MTTQSEQTKFVRKYTISLTPIKVCTYGKLFIYI